jgi:transcriptional regulator with PAS, ATPase and Fis domain
MTNDDRGASPGCPDWARGLPAAITVCDEQGTILEMNDRAAQTFSKSGGRALIGSNVLDCHPEPARTKLAAIMSERRANTYTIEKGGKRKLIHQSPWFAEGVYRGFVEISFELPDDVPHFFRD